MISCYPYLPRSAHVFNHPTPFLSRLRPFAVVLKELHPNHLQWVSLAQAAQRMTNDVGGAVRLLVNVRNQLERISDQTAVRRLRELQEYLTGLLLSQLRQSATGFGSGDEQLLRRIQVLQWMQDLDANNVESRSEMSQMLEQVKRLVRPLRERAVQLRLGDELRSSLQVGEDLLGKISAVRSGLQLGRPPTC